ncbi:MAG: hypothetical protein JAZ02_12410 [Candidatus Thiodiazotropha endolucinida]|nr:hypothetical protein [Candidatus Thiodiazotropha endolucinida]
MSSILDALERASQERMPGKTDILPDTTPVFDENKTVFHGLLLLLVLLISSIAAFWFLFDDGTSKPETPANAEQMTNPVIRPQATLQQSAMVVQKQQDKTNRQCRRMN